MTTREESEHVINTIAAIEVDPGQRITEEQMIEIAHAFDGNDDLFWQLDSYPSRYAYIRPADDWHWKLRQARNYAMAKTNLFKIMKADKEKKANA